MLKNRVYIIDCVNLKVRDFDEVTVYGQLDR